MVIPLIMVYRRGYFINFGERLECIKNILNRKSAYLSEEWIIRSDTEDSSSIRLLSREGYWAIITLKSDKIIEYKLGENKGFWIDDIIHKDNILLRKWQKGTQYKYDVIPIKEHE